MRGNWLPPFPHSWIYFCDVLGSRLQSGPRLLIADRYTSSRMPASHWYVGSRIITKHLTVASTGVNETIYKTPPFLYARFFFVDVSDAQRKTHKTVADIPGPRSLPVFGTRWIYWKFGLYKLNAVHLAYKGKYTSGRFLRQSTKISVPSNPTSNSRPGNTLKRTIEIHTPPPPNMILKSVRFYTLT